MKSMQIIRQYVQKIPYGKPFNAATFRGIATYANTRRTLSRLAKTREITRAAHDIFVRPKEVPYLGKALPEANEIAKIIAKNSGETRVIHGAEATRLLQLSTQVLMKPLFYTTDNSRRIKIGSSEIIFKHISPRKMIKPGTMTGLVISALWYLSKNNVTKNVIEKIKKQSYPQLLGLIRGTLLYKDYLLTLIKYIRINYF